MTLLVLLSGLTPAHALEAEVVPPMALGIPHGPVVDVAVLDVNDDGQPDVAACTGGAVRLGWFLTDGTAHTWTDGPPLPFTECSAIAGGDFDGDSQDDLAISTDDGLWIAYLDGDGTAPVFQQWNTTDLLAEGLQVGDLDLNGVDDVVVWRPGAGAAQFRYGAAGQRLPLASRSGPAVPSTATHVVGADLDHDGDLDLAWLDAPAGAGELLLVDHTETVDGALASDVAIPFTVPLTAEALFLEDLDHDGLLDPVLTSEDSGLHSPLSGGGTVDLAVGGTGGMLADHDHDGELELVALDSGGFTVGELQRHGVEVQRLDRTRNLAPFTPPADARTLSADLDRDADDDLILVTDTDVYVAWNRTPHHRVAMGGFDHTVGITAPGTGQATAADLNGDGWLDLVVGTWFDVDAGFIDRPATVYLNNGTGIPLDITGSWTPVVLASEEMAPGMQPVDYDRDGDVDLVGVALSGGIRLFENATGDGTLWTEHPVDATSTHVALGDLDQDGRVDLIGATSALTWFPNPGDWTVPPAVVLEADNGTPFTALHAGDVDDDGLVDLVAGRGETIAWWQHPGDPLQAWSAHTLWTLLPGNTARTLALEDFDHDGRVDLFVDRAPADGRPSVYTAPPDPTQPWSALDRGEVDQGGTALGAVADLDSDGVPDGLTGRFEQGYFHRFGRYPSPAFETGVSFADAVDEDLDTVGAADLFKLGRPQLLSALRLTQAHEVLAQPLTTVTAGPGPQDAERATWIAPRAPLRLDLSHAGLVAADAELAPSSFDVAGSLDGLPLTGPELLDLVSFHLRYDVDGDGLFDPAVDLSAVVDPEVQPTEDVRLTVDLSTVDAGTSMPYGAHPSTGWFLEVLPTYAGSAQPLATLELVLRAGSVAPVSLPGGSAVDHQGLAADTVATVVLGNTPPTVPELRVQVTEGGLVEFDGLSGAFDADGDALSLAQVVADPPEGTVEVVTGSTLRFTHDASEGDEVFFLVEVDDGIETALRLIVVDVDPVDDPPVGTGLTVQTTEDISVDFELSGSDPDDVVSLEIVTQPTSGSVVSTPGDQTLAVTYTPDPNYVGADFLEFVVHGGVQSTAPLRVDVDVVETDLDDDDGDGVIDAIDRCPDLADPLQADLDGDGLGDLCDDDDDGDGILDVDDPCPGLAAPPDTGADDPCTGDDDGDGVLDLIDNCPHVANPSQDDLDSDLRGDACDLDDDGDLVEDLADNCPDTSNRAQDDADGDGLGNACDDDDDDDGVLDGIDVCPWTPDPAQTDTDGDGTGDACDGDRDGDGAPTDFDCDDNEPAVWSELTFYDDPDGDGFGDGQTAIFACAAAPPEGASWDGTDNCPADPNPDQADSDDDGLGDVCDPTPGYPQPEDTGTPPSPGDTGGPGDPGPSGDTGAPKDDGEGCGCQTTGGTTPGLLPLLLLALCPVRRQGPRSSSTAA